MIVKTEVVFYTLGMVSIYYVKERVSGKWNVPKGHIREGEEPLQGCQRIFRRN